MFIGISLAINQFTGGGAARWGDGPAPPGYRWEFVFDDMNGNAMVFDDLLGEPVVDLVEI